ncbi:MAG: hypothetical protein IKP28_00840 [Clostridia bacterium]|nr:hypothetical protein [Clostridia bacterium]
MKKIIFGISIFLILIILMSPAIVEAFQYGIIGDIDAKDGIGLTDILRIKQHLIGISNLNYDEAEIADADNNGRVNLTDLIKVKRMFMGNEAIKYRDNILHHKKDNSGNEYYTYAYPDEDNMLSKLYTVYIKLPTEADTEANWQEVACYDVITAEPKTTQGSHNELVTVKENEKVIYNVHTAYAGENENKKEYHTAFVQFDFKGEINVKIKTNIVYSNGDKVYVSKARIRPSNEGVSPYKVSTDDTRFTLRESGNYSFEVYYNNRWNTETNLCLFTDEIQEEKPFYKTSVEEKQFYLSAGIHYLDSGLAEDTELKEANILKKKKINGKDVSYLDLPSDSCLYIEKGAIFKGNIRIQNASNVKVLGGGILDQSEFTTEENGITNYATYGVSIRNSQAVSVDGIIIKTPSGYGVSTGDLNLGIFNNIKIFSAGRYTDGIDLMSSSNIIIRKCFLRTNDDSIAIYGSRGQGGYCTGKFLVALNEWDPQSNTEVPWNQLPRLKKNDIDEFLGEIADKIDIDKFVINYDENGNQILRIGDASNYMIVDNILWADDTHTINIGTHGYYIAENETDADFISNIYFDNIDILECKTISAYYSEGAAINFRIRDKVVVENINFNNIRIEDISYSRIACVYQNPIADEANFAPSDPIGNYNYVQQIDGCHAGLRASNITFSNISYKDNGTNKFAEFENKKLIQILGNVESQTSNISFENVKINNNNITLSDIQISDGTVTNVTVE